MTNEKLLEILLNALAVAYLSNEFASVDEYMDCVRQVKERFND